MTVIGGSHRAFCFGGSQPSSSHRRLRGDTRVKWSLTFCTGLLKMGLADQLGAGCMGPFRFKSRSPQIAELDTQCPLTSKYIVRFPLTPDT
ncbi:hypothetical protein ACOMHN_003993 [Nucella lapillus]